MGKRHYIAPLGLERLQSLGGEPRASARADFPTLMRVQRAKSRYLITRFALLAIVGVAATICGCVDFLVNQTTSLGGEIAGGRGSVRVLFINNTSDRAVFTFGTYDQTDSSYVPDFAQFTVEGGTTLDAGQTSSIAASNLDASLQCARAFSIGSPELLELIRKNVPADLLDDADEEALLEGVEFFAIPDEADGADETTAEDIVDGADADADVADGEDGDADAAASEADAGGETATEPTSRGMAQPFEALLGVDFPCNSLLIIRFEINDTGAEAPFRIDFEFVPSESDR